MHVESTHGRIGANTQAPAAADSAGAQRRPACVRKRTDRSFGAGTLMTAPDLSALVTIRSRHSTPGAAVGAGLLFRPGAVYDQ